jgi:thiaminase/transcriptional activator TenA
MSETAESLVAAHDELWPEIAGHPFVLAAAADSLPVESFDRWLVAHHWLLMGTRRFLAGLVLAAPGEYARDVLAGAFEPMQGVLDLFRHEAAVRGLDLDDEPGPVTLGYTSYLLASLHDGFDVALAALYATAKARLDAWTAVSVAADATSPYRHFLDAWSSPAYAGWVAAVDDLLGRAAVNGPTGEMYSAFGRVTRFEIDLWDAIHTGEGW